MRQITSITLIGTVLLLTSQCSSNNATDLIDNLKSTQNMTETRQLLSTRVHEWQQFVDRLPPDDKRPKRDFVTLVGSYQSRGCDGKLKLTFFNDRLMRSEFAPSNPTCYFSALRNAGMLIPSKPGDTIRLSKHTEFTYYQEPAIRFLWEDTKLAAEWNSWVARYS